MKARDSGTWLPRVDPQANASASAAAGAGDGGSYYQRIPEVAQTKLEARRREGSQGPPVMVSSGCGEGGSE